MKNSKQVPEGIAIFVLTAANAIVLRNGFTESDKWYWALLFTALMLAIILINDWVKGKAR